MNEWGGGEIVWAPGILTRPLAFVLFRPTRRVLWTSTVTVVASYVHYVNRWTISAPPFEDYGETIDRQDGRHYHCLFMGHLQKLVESTPARFDRTALHNNNGERAFARSCYIISLIIKRYCWLFSLLPEEQW